MKHVLWFIMVMTFCGVGFSNIDSLRTHWDSQLELDRIESIIQLAKEAESNEEAKALLEKALQIANSEKQDTLSSKVFSAIADYFSRSGQVDSALFYINKMILLPRIHYSTRGSCYRRIGKIYKSQGKNEKAFAAFEKERIVFAEVGDLGGQAGALIDKGLLYYRVAKLDSAIIAFELSKELSLKAEDKYWLAVAHSNLGLVYYRNGNYPACSENLLLSISLFEEVKDYEQTLKVKSNLAALYNKIGLYDQSLKLSFEVLRTCEELGLKVRISRMYNTIANVYENLEEYDKAMKFHEKALALRVELADTSRQSVSLNNIGHVLLRQEKWEQALKYFERSLHLKQLGKDRNLGTVIGNIGGAHFGLGNVKKAEEYFLESIRQSRVTSDEDPLRDNLISLAELYSQQGKYFEASRALDESRTLAENAEDWDAQKENYQLSKLLYEKTGNYKLALEYADKLKSVSDSILNQDKQWAIAGESIRYQKEQLESENRLLKYQQISDRLVLQAKNETDEKKSSFIIALIIGAVMLLALAGLLYRRYLEKRNANQRIKMLMRELHHRVKNNLQILSSLLSLQSSRLEDQTAKNAVKGGEERVNAMMLIHQKLYSEDEVTDIDMREYVTKLTSNLMHSYGVLANHIQLSIDVEDFELDVDKAIPLGLIINELVSNSFKYAFEEQDDPKLSVHLKRAGSSKLNLLISDNGKGIPGEFDLSKADSFGLKMVNILSKQLKGQLQRNNESGLQYHFTFPI